ncbi:uncharacterized protein LOC116428049 isoform X1 [Nomia melanderi]|uniref:uncharacterized protein LOC116428049 isoform X1 n=1 Tax=Nomia melanderi TaxID=2448451 RepID=UPI0013041561|nr:uncharacterized protein LOC116428049 isoform X1 [Nomia melanderi]XP_031834966.1 uncharacterized protein LOC116428049 isoform X1 [Nomia melanderi]XP_031834967.1 uncharacterized protein LOC116428049 isoform X1 [Nomia melanderi]XP_031834968.1 uncharacterized protein LOC116428049 isoform X1 [Nomia melanderi]XP_031834969.1 uncharacterized protein LOC116428049 isoform X1 [Nomia melanderi]XP_031834970.1 uncharacterized protein LOC116428049 isoform X1 [Nomia melanderi]XP_031834972.1 uncharacterize
MGIDSMRVGGGRCPPLLVGGLLVTCLMLICSWWTLSSENIELVRQIDELNEQLKISAEERDQCVTLRGNLEKRYKHTEKEVESLHVLLEQQTYLKKKNDELEETSNTCKTKLDSLHSTLETLKSEKDNFNTQLDEKRDENKKLQEEIDQLKDELDKVKLTCSKPSEKNSEFTQQSTRTANNKTQLGSVPESAVRVSVAGQRGLKYHGIPILPRDPPGAVRLSPRLSVTMLKAEASPKQENKDDTAQNNVDAAEVEEQDNSRQENVGTTDDNIVESQRDQQMIASASGTNK